MIFIENFHRVGWWKNGKPSCGIFLRQPVSAPNGVGTSKRFCPRIRLGILSAVMVMMMVCGAVRIESAEPKAAEETGLLLIENGLLDNPGGMVRAKMIAEMDAAQITWEKKFEQLLTDSDLEAYQTEMREFFLRQLGAMWEKTPLNPQITGRITKNGFRVEKILLETLPNFYATGTMFLPDESVYPPPYPAVLVACGHADIGKAYEPYQGLCVLGALHGLAMYVQDPIDQGERMQHLRNGQPYLSGTRAHNLVGAGSLLLGRNTATFETWDMIRALDYLQSRSDIIPQRLGMAGNSGGGTQTSYVMALDDRVIAAAPSCYLCGFFGNQPHRLVPQDAEQNIFGQLAFGMDHADYVMMRAPKPTLVMTKTEDFFNIDGAWRLFRFGSRLYAKCRAAENLAMIESAGKHGYSPDLLEATVRWMIRHLTDRNLPVHCPPIPEQKNLTKLALDSGKTSADYLPILTEAELESTPHGVMALPHARTTYDLNRDLNHELVSKRKEHLAEMSVNDFAAEVRTVAGIRPFAEIPIPKKIADGHNSSDFILSPEEGIFLPVRVENHSDDPLTLTLVVTEQGRRSEAVNRLLAESPNRSTAVVELRGWGETQNVGPEYYRHDWFGTDGVDFYYAYLMGKSYIGIRTEDLLATANYFFTTGYEQITLVADGPSSGRVALHAAATAPGTFLHVIVPDDIPEWSQLVENSPTPIRLTDTIHGVLNFYDMSDLRRFVLSPEAVKK